MEIAITESRGLPQHAYLSMRVGDTRRQAPAERNEPFRFPKTDKRHLIVDVFEKIGSTQVSLVGLGADGVPEQNEAVTIARADGSNMDLKLQVSLSGMGAPNDESDGRQRAARKKTVQNAKGYLEINKVQDMLQDMVHGLLTKQPEEPLQFMMDFLEGKRKASAGTGTGVPLRTDQAATKPPGLGDSALHGFPVDVAPERLPDLTRNASVCAAVLRDRPSTYSRLRAARTGMGVSFASCVKPGVDDSSAVFGLVAGDAESYDRFREIFDPFLESVHGGYALAGSHTMGPDLGKVAAVSLDSARVLSVSASLSRCFQGLRFPPACSACERLEAERAAVEALMNFTGDFAGEYFPASGSSSQPARPVGSFDTEASELLKAGLSMQTPHTNFALSAGLGRHWPEGRGVFVTTDQGLSVRINEQDHLQLRAAAAGADLLSVVSRVARAEVELADALRQAGHAFAHSSRVGYLCTNPSDAGTGLRAGAVLLLPKLSTRDGFKGLCARLGLAVAPATRASGQGAWELSNARRLGSAAAEQVTTVLRGCEQLLQLEAVLEVGEEVDLSGLPLDGAELVAEAARARGLWEGGLTAAREKAAKDYPAEHVRQYFDEVDARLRSPEYAEHVKSTFFARIDTDHDGKISFDEAAVLIKKSLRCAADLVSQPKPTPDEIRAAFDAHVTKVDSNGRLGLVEFLNLARYLQVRVAEAMLPLSNVVAEKRD